MAISTARGCGARGVVRESGNQATSVVEHWFRPARGMPRISELRWGATRGRLVVGRSATVVPVWVWCMRGVRSYTREDMIEVHMPGSMRLLEIVCELFQRRGARAAEPGEFTKRAYLSGRIDLAQVEAVAALIDARGEAERRSALSVLQGSLSERLSDLSARLLAVLTPVELEIDFSDQDIEIIGGDTIVRDLEDLAAEFDELIGRRRAAAAISDRARVVLVGAVNAGKSSLFNCLVGAPRAIVSAEPGTTRDAVESEISIGSFAVCVIDTAGEGHTASSADVAAHDQRARAVKGADLVVGVVDGSVREPALIPDADLVALTHADLVEAAARRDLGARAIWVSSVTKEGIQELERAIERGLGAADALDGAAQNLNQRHLAALEEARDAVLRARGVAARDEGIELVAAEIRTALAAVRGITGDDYDEMILDRILRNFCIGK